MIGQGTLDLMPEGWGFIRRVVGETSEQDPYVSPAQIQEFGLKSGDLVRGEVRPPRVHEAEKYYGMVKIESINGREPG